MDPSPKILIAAGIYPPDPGGPALHAHKQFEWFKRRRIKVSLVALAHFRFLPRFVRHAAFFFALITRAWKCDLIYGHDSVGVGIPALLVSKFWRKPLVIRIGGDIAWERQGKNLSMLEWYKSGAYSDTSFFRLSRWVLLQSRAIIVPSPLLSKVYIKYYGIDPEKIKVISNPSPSLAELGGGIEDEISIVYASRLTAYKNLELVLRVFSRILPSHPDLILIIMGDGPERNRLEKLTQALGIVNETVFTGTVPQTEVVKAISKCRLVIAPALTEFNPNYVLQGIALGKPFLLSREHGFSFSIPEELLFNPRDEAELEVKMTDLLDESRYLKIQEKLRHLEIQVSWEDNLVRNLEVIQSLI